MKINFRAVALESPKCVERSFVLEDKVGLIHLMTAPGVFTKSKKVFAKLTELSYEFDKIFGFTFLIPDYQRTVVWEMRLEENKSDAKECRLFYENTKNAFDGSIQKEALDIGTVILLACGDNKFEIVDGQQKLKQALILFRACCDSMYNIDHNTEGELRGLINQILGSRIQPRMFLDKESDKVFNSLVFYREITDQNVQNIKSRNTSDEKILGAYNGYMKLIASDIKEKRIGMETGTTVNTEEQCKYILNIINSLVFLQQTAVKVTTDRNEALRLYFELNSAGRVMDMVGDWRFYVNFSMASVEDGQRRTETLDSIESKIYSYCNSDSTNSNNNTLKDFLLKSTETLEGIHMKEKNFRSWISNNIKNGTDSDKLLYEWSRLTPLYLSLAFPRETDSLNEQFFRNNFGGDEVHSQLILMSYIGSRRHIAPLMTIGRNYLDKEFANEELFIKFNEAFISYNARNMIIDKRGNKNQYRFSKICKTLIENRGDDGVKACIKMLNDWILSDGCSDAMIKSYIMSMDKNAIDYTFKNRAIRRFLGLAGYSGNKDSDMGEFAKWFVKRFKMVEI